MTLTVRPSHSLHHESELYGTVVSPPRGLGRPSTGLPDLHHGAAIRLGGEKLKPGRSDRLKLG